MNQLESTNKLSTRTTPTWEVELLISGGAVFAMLQLPGLLDTAFFWMEPRFAGDLRKLVTMAYVYSQSATFMLAGTFVVHLLLRARWIALVGMHSVHPDGIRLENLTLSPIQREVECELEKPFPDLIERADNKATTVFAIGVMLTFMMVGVAVIAIALFSVSIFLAFLAGGKPSAIVWAFLLMATFFLPFGVAAVIDLWRGATLAKENKARRLTKAIMKRYAAFGLARVSNPIMALMASQEGDRKTIMLTSGFMALSLIAVFPGIALLSNLDRLGSYTMFPWQGAPAPEIDSAHYDTRRNPLRDGATPYIQDIVATGPYVKLVLPYKARLDDPAMRKHCRHADMLDDQEQSTARFDCLSALHPVSLDGQQLTTLRYDVSSDPRTDRPALLAMIDVRTLATGRHELRIGQAPPATDDPVKKGSKAERDTQDYVIPFWR
ncbi:hypothetical protein [Thermomonas sp.]